MVDIRDPLKDEVTYFVENFTTGTADNDVVIHTIDMSLWGQAIIQIEWRIIGHAVTADGYNHPIAGNYFGYVQRLDSGAILKIPVGAASPLAASDAGPYFCIGVTPTFTSSIDGTDLILTVDCATANTIWNSGVKLTAIIQDVPDTPV